MKNILFILLLIFVACGGQKEKKPLTTEQSDSMQFYFGKIKDYYDDIKGFYASIKDYEKSIEDYHASIKDYEEFIQDYYYDDIKRFDESINKYYASINKYYESIKGDDEPNKHNESNESKEYNEYMKIYDSISQQRKHALQEVFWSNAIAKRKLIHGEPEITPLPFNAHYDSVPCYNAELYHAEMKKLTLNAPKCYALPVVDKWNLVVTGDNWQNYNPGTILEDQFNFSYYRYQFPDIGMYKVYLVCDTVTAAYSKYKININDTYETAADITGFLILYNPHNRMAHIIEVFNNFQIQLIEFFNNFQLLEKCKRTTFDIDTNYVIHFKDYHSAFLPDAPELGKDGVMYMETLRLGQKEPIVWGEVFCNDQRYVKICKNGNIELYYPLRQLLIDDTISLYCYSNESDAEINNIRLIKPTTITISPDGEIISTVTQN